MVDVNADVHYQVQGVRRGGGGGGVQGNSQSGHPHPPGRPAQLADHLHENGRRDRFQLPVTGAQRRPADKLRRQAQLQAGQLLDAVVAALHLHRPRGDHHQDAIFRAVARLDGQQEVVCRGAAAISSANNGPRLLQVEGHGRGGSSTEQDKVTGDGGVRPGVDHRPARADGHRK